MKRISEQSALENLAKAKADFRRKVSRFEANAKNCQTCETKGACCLDAHFVNVRITKLEAVAVKDYLSNFDGSKQIEIAKRISETIEKYNLKDADKNIAKTFACPLFEREAGCLIHAVKPVSCIQHACYEFREDLPPDELQDEVEAKIARLNQQTYGENFSFAALPVQLEK